MKRISVFFDYLAESLNEILDLLLHTILFTFIITYIIGGYHELAYILFFVIPVFILFSPFIKNIHKRSKLEFFIKIPTYLFLGLIIFITSYIIFTYNSGEEYVRTSTKLTFFIIFIGMQSYWVIATLRRLSKPKPSLKTRKEKAFKTRLIAFVLSLCAWITSFTLFQYLENPNTGYEVFLIVPAAIIMAIVALIITSFFFVSIIERR